MTVVIKMGVVAYKLITRSHNKKFHDWNKHSVGSLLLAMQCGVPEMAAEVSKCQAFEGFTQWLR